MWQRKQCEISPAAQETVQFKQAHESKQSELGDSGIVEGSVNDSFVFKVKFPLKAFAFCASVMTLSWFFEGWRRIHTAVDLRSTSLAIFILIAGVVFTAILIGLQAFWIYAEEKQKGSLLRRLELFEKLYVFFVQRKRALAGKRGEKTKHA
jgi:hypothetical protein